MLRDIKVQITTESSPLKLQIYFPAFMEATQAFPITMDGSPEIQINIVITGLRRLTSTTAIVPMVSQEDRRLVVSLICRR